MKKLQGVFMKRPQVLSMKQPKVLTYEVALVANLGKGTERSDNAFLQKFSFILRNALQRNPLDGLILVN